jgi:mRNA interferase RelE/StbE
MTKRTKWAVTFTKQADKTFAKLDRSVKKEIEKFISTRLIPTEDPRLFGKPLKGNLLEYWRYRVGDYRIICKIEDDELVILVVRVAHRKEVYSLSFAC